MKRRTQTPHSHDVQCDGRIWCRLAERTPSQYPCLSKNKTGVMTIAKPVTITAEGSLSLISVREPGIPYLSGVTSAEAYVTTESNSMRTLTSRKDLARLRRVGKVCVSWAELYLS